MAVIFSRWRPALMMRVLRTARPMNQMIRFQSAHGSSDQDPAGEMSGHQALVSARWLYEHGNQSDVRLLDTTWDLAEAGNEQYKEKHIPGAIFYNLNHCIKPTQLIPRNFPDLECFEEYLRSLGVKHKSHVIFYDRRGMIPAARAWWMLRACGHKTVSVLDGGLYAWENEGYDVTKELPPTPKPGNIRIHLQKTLIRQFEDVEKLIGSHTEQLVDTRQPEHFTGTAGEPNDKTVAALQWWKLPLPSKMHLGHVPGALNVPWTDLYDDSGQCMKSKEELKKVFEKAGVDLNKPTTSMCYIGHTANVFSLAAAHLGKDDVATYYGSWTEWAQRAKPEKCEQGPPRTIT